MSTKLVLFSEIPLYCKFKYESAESDGTLYVKTSATHALYEKGGEDVYKEISPSTLVFPVASCGEHGTDILWQEFTDDDTLAFDEGVERWGDWRDDYAEDEDGDIIEEELWD